MSYTFYSFKGGVGRSMAMANVAWELARRGLRVLAIDFDLEAPGLERYFDVAVPDVQASPGVIDLIAAFSRSLSGNDRMDDQAEFRQLARYTYRGVADFGKGGVLDLMPAGRRGSEEDKRAYALAVRTFDWQDFYYNWEGQAFFDWLRRTLVEGEEALYDVVLADSRTGVTEMGGVCACQLADVVVMLSAPNHQNVIGTQDLAIDLTSKAVQSLRQGRDPLRVVVVPARVEQRVPELLVDFEQRFESALGRFMPDVLRRLGLDFSSLALPYVPEFAFEEQVAHEGRGDPGRLSERFRHLADALLALCTDDPGTRRGREAAAARARLAPQESAAPQAPVPQTAAFDPSRRSAGVDAYISCPRDSRGVVQEVLAALHETGQRLRTEFGEAEAFGTEQDLPLTAREQLRHADTLVLCADMRGVRPWQRAELKAARALPQGPAVVQVLLPGAPEDAFLVAFGEALRDAPLIDLRGGMEQMAAVQLLVSALRSRQRSADKDTAEASAAATPAADEASPFPGVAPYAEEHHAVFFGREGECAELVNHLAFGRRAELHGPSGCGKTSLLRAAVLPALRQVARGSLLQYVDLAALMAQEAEARSAECQRLQTLDAEAWLLLDHADSGDEAMMAWLLHLWRSTTGPRVLLAWRRAPLPLAEAQATSRWRSDPEGARHDHRHTLHHTCDWGPSATALMAEAASVPSCHLQPLRPSALRAAIEQALAKTGRRAEAGLIERMFADAGAAPAAATLQRALLPLWQQQVRGWLANDAYDSLGGIDGLYTAELKRCGEGAADLLPAALRALMRRLLLRGPDAMPTLGALWWARAASQPVCAGQAGATMHGLVVRGLARVQRVEGDAHVQLSHRPREWQGLNDLFDIDDDLELVPVLATAQAYETWALTGRDDTADAALEALTARAMNEQLSGGELSFVVMRGTVRRQMQKRRQRMLVATGLVLSGAVLVAGWQSYSKRLVEDEAAAAAAIAASAAARASEAATQRELDRLRAQQQQTAVLGSSKYAAQTDVLVVAYRTGGRENPADLRLASQLLEGLPAANYTIEPAVQWLDRRTCGEVRFNDDADIASARMALDTLNAALAARSGELRQLRLERGAVNRAAARPGVIEVLLPPMSDAPPTAQHRWGESRLVTAGCAIVGSDQKGREALRGLLKADDAPYYGKELDLRTEFVRGYYIGTTEVTAEAFATYQRECEQQRKAECPPWTPRFLDPQREPRRPATWVSWAQADAYCRWAGGRLPTDVEWEKAARGIDGRFWPWGDQLEEARFQGKSQPEKRPVSVGSKPAGHSPYGVADMAGNVYEFTADTWSEDGSHSMRGGSYLNSLMESRTSVRWATRLEKKGADFVGFRCVVDTPP
jgi:hypothetical protein